MVWRDHGMWEVLQVLRRAQRGEAVRAVARATGRSRGTVRRYVEAAVELGWQVGGSEEPSEELAGRVLARLRPGPRDAAPGPSEQALAEQEARIRAWLAIDEPGRKGLKLRKVHTLLAREGVVVPYSSLHRWAVRELGFGRQVATVRMADVAPGEVAEVDFGRLGLIWDPDTAKRRTVWALVVTLVYSRHMYVWVTFRQQIGDLIAGLDAAWTAFGGITARLVLDNMKTAVTTPDRYDPELARTFDEYAQTRGVVLDPAVPREPTHKPHVERQVPYVREGFFAGEQFVGRADCQARAVHWCEVTAGMRVHGTTRQQPKEVFESTERAALLPFSGERFDVPRWAEVKVHPDCHVRVGHALYSVPYRYRGEQVTVRSDSALVRIYVTGQLVKTHAMAPPGQRRTDFGDYPVEKTPYAMRDAAGLSRKAREHGEGTGRLCEILLSGTFPWAKLRQAQKLLRLVEKFGAERVDVACRRALMYEVVNVSAVERIVLQASDATAPETTTQTRPAQPALRFLRDGHTLRETPREKESQ